MMAMTAAQKKARQRERDRLKGWVHLTVKVGQEHAQAVKDFVASLPDPSPPHDPRQLDLIDRIEEELAAGDISLDQGRLF